jgi:hypothetical protein
MKQTRLSSLKKNSLVSSKLREVWKKPDTSSIEAFEKDISNLPQLEIVPTHYTTKDAFVREILFPKGCFMIGRIAKYDHILIMLSGKMQIWNEDIGIHILEGPNIIQSRSGIRRAGIALEETRWATVHGAPGMQKDSTIDNDLVFDFFTTATMAEYQEFIAASPALPAPCASVQKFLPGDTSAMDGEKQTAREMQILNNLD